jgi:hypothetical protein
MHTAAGEPGRRIGVLLPTRQGIGFDAAPLARAEQAEALGLDSVFAGESILARQLEPLARDVAPRLRELASPAA